ncbi:UNVERIFIED_CONTAM: hypothetical protein FKN15_013021 [Acipenser sinensis]
MAGEVATHPGEKEREREMAGEVAIHPGQRDMAGEVATHSGERERNGRRSCHTPKRQKDPADRGKRNPGKYLQVLDLSPQDGAPLVRTGTTGVLETPAGEELVPQPSPSCSVLEDLEYQCLCSNSSFAPFRNPGKYLQVLDLSPQDGAPLVRTGTTGVLETPAGEELVPQPSPSCSVLEDLEYQISTVLHRITEMCILRGLLRDITTPTEICADSAQPSTALKCYCRTLAEAVNHRDDAEITRDNLQREPSLYSPVVLAHSTRGSSPNTHLWSWLTPPEGAQPILTCGPGSLHQRESNLRSP